MQTHFFPAWRPILAPMRAQRPASANPLERATLCQIEQRLAPALPAALLDKPAKGLHSRERIFSLARTFWCWIWQIFQSNTSCREVVDQLQTLLGVLEEPLIDQDSSAYCQARAKLSLPLLEQALVASHQSAQKHAPASSLLQGRAVKVVDASSVRLEDTPQNREAFPASKNQFSRPAFPLLKFLTVFSLASGALLARATGTMQVAELRLLMTLGEHFKPGDIITGDRAYGLYVVLQWVQSLGADLVARLNTRSRHVDFRKALKKLGPQDGLFLWHKPKLPSKLLSAQQWAAVPETLVVRILRLRVQKPGFRTRELTIVTTLLDAQLYPAEEILETYFKRWRLEMCLDDLKTTLAMEKLKCRTPAVVQKELLMFLIAHNFLRWIMCQAAQQAQVKVERISFTGTLDAFRQWSIGFLEVRGPGKLAKQKRLWAKFLQTLASDLLPERPGRVEPRAVKKKSKYPKLTKPRGRYVERWSRNKRRRAQRAKNRALLN